jgi:hypothetical protein
MIYLKKYSLLLIAVLMVCMVSACSDDPSTAPEPDEDAPELPGSVIPVQIDLGYFAAQDIPQEEEYSNFLMVKMMAETAGSMLNSGGNFLAPVSEFLGMAGLFGVDPVHENGTWSWTFQVPSDFLGDFYDDPSDAQDAVIRILGTPSGNSIHWEVLFTGLLYDVQVSDFTFMTGTLSLDELSGEWKLFSPEEEINSEAAVLTYSWQIDSEENYGASVLIEYMGDVFTIDYSRNGSNNEISFNDGDTTQTLNWDTNAHSGIITTADGSSLCYENFINTECT